MSSIDKKITNLQSESNQHGSEIEKIKLLLREKDEEEEKPSENETKNEESTDDK